LNSFLAKITHTVPAAWQDEPADQGEQFGLNPIQLPDPFDAFL